MSRFDKPTQLATSIIVELLSIPSQSHELFEGLMEFLILFSDQLSTLESLKITNLGEFLLFTLFARCLPLSIRKGFEVVNTQEFPTAYDVL